MSAKSLQCRLALSPARAMDVTAFPQCLFGEISYACEFVAVLVSCECHRTSSESGNLVTLLYIDLGVEIFA